MEKRLLLVCLLLATFITSSLFGQSSCCNYTDTGQNPGPGVESETFGIALGDIDNDGDNDAVIVDAYDDMEVYLNDSTGIFTYDQTYGSSKSWFGVYLVDADMDGDLDIIVSGFYSGVGCEFWKNDGSGNFSFSQGGIASSIGMEELGIGDVNGDTYPDIFAPASSGSGSQVWLNDGSGFFTNSGQTLIGSSCTQAVLADLDGDNDLDAFVSRTNGNANTVWLNDGAGNFTDSGQALGSAFSTGADAADVDDDGDVDIVVSNWQTPSQVWTNDGNANFSSGFQIQNNNFAKSIVLSDIDYDCDFDAVIGSYGSNGVQVWTNDGSGVFSLCFENNNSVYAQDIAVADLNGDWMPDIWAGNFSSSSGDHIYLKSTPVFVYDTLYLCPDDSLFVGCDWQTTDGDFLEAINCDTLSWYHVDEVEIDTSVTRVYDTLFAIAGYNSYRWLDCATMTAVPGADNYYFVSDTSGFFAVEITEHDCVDTSSCHWLQVPLADFEGTPTSGEDPLTVSFTDLSVGTVTSWGWDFGDGNTSTLQNPDNEYVNIGLYTVSLIVTGPGGSDTLIKTDYINVDYSTPTSDFVGDPTSGLTPLEVTFTDLSADSVDTWSWNFGDGEYSNLQSPAHTYNAAGAFTVSLTVSGPGGSDDMVKVDYINTTAGVPVADFIGDPTSGNSPLDVSFTDLSLGTIDSWEWDFGDGGGSVLQSPEYVYDTSGIYTVSLITSGPGGSDTIVKTDYISVTEDAPIADFMGSPTFGEAPLLVSFVDLTTGNVDSWLWHFGDGDSSTVQNPSHEYLTPGNFTVSLTSTGSGGSDTEIKTDYILIPVGTTESAMEAIIVYPNPASNKLNIVFPTVKRRSIILRNMDGKQVFRKTTLEKEETISLMAFPEAGYTLIITSGDNIVSIVKVVKK
ncbi:MAG: PKD domain-containing protein [Chlorobi bacterium]|nr:PKD domain-containing protein [Chlorobiota bacterium]